MVVNLMVAVVVGVVLVLLVLLVVVVTGLCFSGAVWCFGLWCCDAREKHPMLLMYVWTVSLVCLCPYSHEGVRYP